jgi:hypothetical protein
VQMPPGPEQGAEGAQDKAMAGYGSVRGQGAGSVCESANKTQKIAEGRTLVVFTPVGTEGVVLSRDAPQTHQGDVPAGRGRVATNPLGRPSLPPPGALGIAPRQYSLTIPVAAQL